MKERPSWDEWFMKMAFLAAERSTCLHHHVGAINVLRNHIVTEGYNSTAPKEPHCSDNGYCFKERKAEERGEEAVSGKGVDDCPAIHAEENAILQAALLGTSLNGASMYATHQPCIHCARQISRVGIVEVKYVFPYADERAIGLLSRKGVKLERIDMPNLDISMLK